MQVSHIYQQMCAMFWPDMLDKAASEREISGQERHQDSRYVGREREHSARREGRSRRREHSGEERHTAMGEEELHRIEKHFQGQ